MLKDLTDTLVGLGGALEVPLGPDDLLDGVTLSKSNGWLVNLEEEGGRGGEHASASVTGFWDVLASSWIVLWSCRRSFLHPTKMIGSPWQK